MNAIPKQHRWTLEAKELGTGTLSPEPYVSPAYFEQLRDKVYRRTWLCSGRRVDEIPKPGDYLVLELEMFSTSILFIRGKDSAVRGFHNTCMHRGNRLATQATGNCRGGLACGFHGWGYSSEGRLASVPEEDMFFDFDRRRYDLAPVAVELWQGFIFFHLNPHPPESLASHLGELAPMIEGYPFDRLPVRWSYTAQLECGWGVLRDSQLEGYHLKYLHRRTVPGTMVNNRDNPSRHVLDVRFFGRHAIGSFYGNRQDHRPAPVEDIATRFGNTLGQTAAHVSDVSRWPAGVNPSRAEDWFFDVCYIFPNFHLVFLGEFLYAAHTMWPVEPGRAVWNARGYLPAPRNAAEQFNREYAKCSVRDLWLEDGSTLEASQRGLASGILKELPLQDQELLIRHAQKCVDEMIAA